MATSTSAFEGGKCNRRQCSKSELSYGRTRLVELMQDINFGRIERLSVVDGDPMLDPRPAIVRERKFPGDNGPRPELESPDFQLKQQVLELFALLDQISDGMIEVLEIKHGLPFRVFLREAGD